MSRGGQVGAEEAVRGLQQVLHVARRPGGCGRGPRRRSRCRSCRSASAPSHGSAKIERPPPAGTIAPATSGSAVVGERDVRPAARPDPRDLRLVVELLGPQAVGPHAGRVDDVGGRDDELLPRRRVPGADAPGPAALVDEVDRPPARSRRPRRSARPRPGRSAPGGCRRSGSRRRGSPSWARAPASAGSRSTTSSPGMTRWRSGAQAPSDPSPPLRRRRRRSIDMTS